MALAWGSKVSPQFARKVVAMSGTLGCDPSHLMSAMAFETGETFSPRVRNPTSGATGLIQFMPDTARALGTMTDALALMTAEQQLDFVAQYFRPYAGRLHSLSDVYMVILWPKAVGKPDDYVLFGGETKQYAQNKGLDFNHDGTVTKAEAAAKVRAKLTKGMQADYCLDLDAQAVVAEAAEEPEDASPPAAEISDAVPLPRERPRDAPQIEPEVNDALGGERPSGPTDYTIEYVQRRLRQLGYFTVGKVDGTEYGSFMRGAITRFKHDKGLHPEDSAVTPAFLALLRDPDCAPAPISDARAAATAEELADQNPTLWSLAWQKVVALATFVGTSFMAAFNWLYEKVGSDFSLVERIGGVVAKMPVWGWLGIASGICLLGWGLVSHGERDQVQKYRRGELL
jgi:hypothetical protein